MNKKTLKLLLYAGFIVVVVALIMAVMSQARAEEPQFKDVLQMFKDGQITECIYCAEDWTMSVTTADKKTYDFSSVYPDMFTNEIFDPYLKESESIKFDLVAAKNTSAWISYAGLALVIIVIIGMMVFMARQTTKGPGSARSFGKIKSKNQEDAKDRVYFKDVAGCDEEKAELQEIVEYLRNPEKFTKLGARIPRGVLLVGPPGTGKTLLAKAVAGEARVPFYSISGSDFVELYVGVGASRVRDLFETARKNPASIIFIDEIDAVGRHRGAGLGGGHDEREQTLNQLLVEMDGFSGREGTIVMAATNRPDILDPALLRPGRFDRQITVSYPDINGREEVLKVHARKKPLEKAVNLRKIAQMTVGMTGADLANILNEAALLAARKGKSLIGMNDIEEAALKVMAGTPKKSFKISEKEKRNTAYHEAGHAILDFYLPTQDPVRQISIVPTSMGALGYTLSHPLEDKFSVYKQELKERIASLLGGRVAETVVFGDYSGGASNDIQRATAYARKMVTQLGMSDLGPIHYGSHQGGDEVFLGRDFSAEPEYSEATAARIDAEVKKIIDEAYKLAESTIREHINKLTFVAEFLLLHETMDEEQFKAAMEEENPTFEAINALADERRRISDEENRRKEAIDEKEREDREKFLREHDENYDETDVNAGKFNDSDDQDSKETPENEDKKPPEDGNKQ